MRKLSVLFIFVTIVSLTGCSNLSNVGGSLAGINIEDLQERKPYSPAKDFDLSYEDTFGLMVDKIRENGLHQYLTGKDKGYIIVIGLKQQVSTTRIGIFIESISDVSTRVTLTSLSTTALDRAQLIFFGESVTDITVLE